MSEFHSFIKSIIFPYIDEIYFYLSTYLYYFSILATVNKVANLSVRISFESLLSVLWGTRSEMGLLDCLVLMLIF